MQVATCRCGFARADLPPVAQAPSRTGGPSDANAVIRVAAAVIVGAGIGAGWFVWSRAAAQPPRPGVATTFRPAPIALADPRTTPAADPAKAPQTPADTQ